MHLSRAIPAVWVHTTGEPFNTTRPGGYGQFLSAEQQARLERIRQARMLFDGHHREYFLDEARTQFDFPRARAGSRVVQLYLTYNVLGLISLKSADLLFGEEPMLRADDDVQQEALSRLVERSSLHRLLYGCAVDASYEAESFLEACVHSGEVYLRQVPADEIFPIGELQPDGQFEQYVRYRVRNAGTSDAPIYLLLEVTYLPGRIERRCFQLTEDGRDRREVALQEWVGATPALGAFVPVGARTASPAFDVHSLPGNPGDAGVAPAGFDDIDVAATYDARATQTSPLRASTETGIARNTITWIPNLLIRGRCVSDYDGAIELQDALNAKNSQLGRVLLKHSDPKMAFPEEAFDQDGNIRSDHDVFAYTDPNKVPQYITWNAELANAMADRSFVLNQLLVRTETSPVLLGIKEGAAPDAYKKVRLESFNSLTKARRKAAYWRAGVRRAVSVAQDLENTLPGVRYERGALGVQLRDGIPTDQGEQAYTLATLSGAGLLSTERAVEEQLQDAAAVRKELGRLRNAPSTTTKETTTSSPRAGAPAPAPPSAPARARGKRRATASAPP